MRCPLVAFFVTALAFCCASELAAQQAQPPKSKAEILKALSQKTEQLDKTLEQMKEKHAKATKNAEADAVTKLKKLAQTEASGGEIAEATETWTDILEIDTTDVEAKKFFRSIGRLDIVEKTLAQAEAKQSVLPTRRLFYEADNGITFRLLPDGSWLETWTNNDRQRIHQERGRNPYHIFLFNRTGSLRVLHIIYPDHYYWKHYLDKKWHLEPAVGAWKE